MNLRSFYFVTIIFLILAISCAGNVSAYYLNLDAPSEVRVGESFVVNGTTNTPPPDRIDIVFSQSINIPVEIARHSIEITEKGDSEFNVTFDTVALEKGNYKVEAISQTQRTFSAGSRNLRVVKMIDRSDIIRFSSPSYQEYEEKLLIEARIQDYDSNSIQMEVKEGNEIIFGPESVPVSRGMVKHELAISKQGSYAVTFTDYKGYIGTYSIQVGEEKEEIIRESTPELTPTPEEINTTSVQTSPLPTQVSTTKATDGTRETVTTPTQTTKEIIQSQAPITQSPLETISGVSATADISRDSPGYFLITVKEIPVIIQTSANEDWVFEYMTEVKGAGIRVNDMMKAASEKAIITDVSDKIFVKAYPYNYKSGKEITITVTNAHSIALSDEAANAFGAPPRYGSQGSAATGKSPAPIFAIIGGIIGAICFWRRKY